MLFSFKHMNAERYADPTADIAIARVMREWRKKEKQKRKNINSYIAKKPRVITRTNPCCHTYVPPFRRAWLLTPCSCARNKVKGWQQCIMAKEFAKPFYNSKAWKDCRAAYVKRRISLDGGMCEQCHQRIGYILHHKRELSPININDPDITLNHCNLIWVCHECHDIIHGFAQEKHTDGPAFDANGQLIPMRE